MTTPEKREPRTIVVDLSKRPRIQPDPKLDALLARFPNFPYDAPKWRLEGASWYDQLDLPDDPASTLRREAAE